MISCIFQLNCKANAANLKWNSVFIRSIRRESAPNNVMHLKINRYKVSADMNYWPVNLCAVIGRQAEAERIEAKSFSLETSNLTQNIWKLYS